MGARTLAESLSAEEGQISLASMRDDRATLDWADQLAQIDFTLYKMMGSQGRFMWHAHKAELARARPHREQLELHAIQGGTTWQSSIMIPFTLAAVHARTGDLAGLRQMAEVLERQAEEVIALRPIAELYRAEYELARGHNQEALAMLERCARIIGPYSCVPWPSAMAAHARALLALGRTTQAREIIERARTHVHPGDFAFTFLYLDLEIAHALVETAEGRLEEAIAHIETLLGRHRNQQGPLTLCRLHEVRARFALLADDMPAFEEHIGEFERWARGTENPSLVARFKRLEGEGRRLLGLTSSSVEPRASRADSFAAQSPRSKGRA
jgi:tetratricopeptide (TPR) repeat protein